MDTTVYSTKNEKMTEAESKRWALSTVFCKPVNQAKVKLNNGKGYDYASRYEVHNGDIAIIGNAYVHSTDAFADTMTTTGELGIVNSVEPKLTIKKNHAAELDFVFTDAVDKKAIAANAKYFQMTADETTLQYGKGAQNIYPLSFLIRQVLAAASVIAFPEYSSKDVQNAARLFITSVQGFSKEVYFLVHSGGYFKPDISLSDIHSPVPNNALEQLENRKTVSSIQYGVIQSHLRKDNPDDDKLWACQELNEYIHNAVYIGAMSIMTRGGFLNMLQAFLSAQPPIEPLMKQMIKLANSMNAAGCANLLSK